MKKFSLSPNSTSKYFQALFLHSHSISELQILTLVIWLCCKLFGDLWEITPLPVFKCCRGCGLKRACGFVIVGIATPSERTCGSGRSRGNVELVISRDQIIVEIFHSGEGGYVEQWLEPRNISMYLWLPSLSLSIYSTHSLTSCMVLYCFIFSC